MLQSPIVDQDFNQSPNKKTNSVLNSRIGSNSTNVVSPSKNSLDSITKNRLKVNKTNLLNRQRELCIDTKHSTMGYCGKYCYTNPTLSSHNGNFKQSGVNVCCSPLCCGCYSSRSMKEAEQVSNLIKFAKHKKKPAFFVTPTQPKITSIYRSYLNVVEGYKKIRKYLSNVKQNKGITVSVYAAPEYTFEKIPYYNGVDLITRAHNHLHIILIFWSDVDSQCQQEVLAGVCKQWNAAIKKSGSYTKKDNMSIDIQRIDYNSDSIEKISNYITKGISGSDIEQMALEITQSNSKIGKGRSFKRLLEDIVRFEKAEDITAYKSLINVTYKKRRVYKNDTFKEYLELANEWIEEEKRKITEEYLKQMNEGLIPLQDFLDWKCKEENIWDSYVGS